jgi:hypothetical protein
VGSSPVWLGCRTCSLTCFSLLFHLHLKSCHAVPVMLAILWPLAAQHLDGEEIAVVGVCTENAGFGFLELCLPD